MALLSVVLGAVLAAGCGGLPGLGSGADTAMCVDAWNHGTKDGKPADGAVSDGQLGAPGASYGFFARQVAVSASEDGLGCRVTFDLGQTTFTYFSGSTGWDPRPRPDISGWQHEYDVRPVSGPMALPAPRWNACQRDDGTLTLETGSCLRAAPPAPPGRISELIETGAWVALMSNIRLSDLGSGRTAFWLGPRFRGAAAQPGVPVPGGASVQVTYLIPDGDHADYVQVLTYSRRLDEVPCLGDDYQCANGLPVAQSVLGRMDTPSQSTLITGSSAAVSPQMLRRIRHALQPVSATSPHPDLCTGPDFDCGVIGVGTESAPVGPPVTTPAPATGGYWLGPDFQGPPLPDQQALPGTVAYLYTLTSHHTSVRVVTAPPDRLDACIHSRYCSQSVYAGIRRTPVIARVRRGAKWVVLIQNGGRPLPRGMVRQMVRAIQPA